MSSLRDLGKHFTRAGMEFTYSVKGSGILQKDEEFSMPFVKCR